MTGLREIRLGRLFERRKILGFVDEPMLSVYRDRGVVLKDEGLNPNKTAEDRSIYQLVEPGWLVVNRMKAWQGAVGVSDLRGIVSGHYICFLPTHKEVHRYLHYLLRSPRVTAHFLSISRGVRPGQIEIDNDELAGTTLALPDAAEQRRIADFLDDRVARIDRIIAARRAQTGLAREERAASLQASFDALVKRHGEGRLGYALMRMEQGWSPQAEGVAAEPEEWGVMRAGCVNGGRFDPDDNKRLPDGLEPARQYEIEGGDLLMSRASGSLDLIGSVAVVPAGVRPRLLLCDKVYRLVPTSEWLPAFLAPMLRAQRNRERIRMGTSGAEGMANNLPSGVVRDLVVPQAPVADQGRLARTAEAADESLASAISALHRSIALLTEYKQALITAAVTGELDVTTAGSGIPG